jgi:cyanate permease
MAACVGIGMSLVAWLFYRDNPEQCGLQMDGARPSHKATGAVTVGSSPAPEQRALPLSAALRTGAFWAVTLALSIHAAVVTGVVFHIVDIGAEAGQSAKSSVALFPPIAVISVTAALTSGAAADRFRLRGLVVVLLAGELTSCIGWARLDESVFLALAIVGTGIASGLFGTLSTLAMAKLFGRAHLGTTSSAQTSALVIGSALGPSLLAASRAAAGSYGPALQAAAVLPVLVLVLTLSSRDPVGSGKVW